jgi:serine/threonine-protein kinase
VLGGLCPACLLREGLDGDHSAAGETRSFANLTHGPISAGVLASLTESCGPVPQTLLRDTDPGPLVLPSSPEMPAAGDRPGRLQLLGGIARGGMGAVLKGRDNDIGRDLAVKVLLESHRDKPELVRRFIEEAQIGGQLQHPGIVPIYELGAFADRRPYFAMKLVKGRTLSALLGERSDPARVDPRFLSIFEQVCQTMAYAHARGVIHRDLKPSNIMVGSFGEVQVMDWGLAKVLPQGGAADDASAGKTRDRDTVIATARSGSDADSDLSRAGSVMGTPSYMAPEQARGETDRLDERCDVFALGSILCELLTGEPAFTGRSSGEIQRKASRGDLKESIDRLDHCGADPDLIALAKDCLAPELEDRPRHAGAVAERITAHRTGVEERLRKAEIAQAEEKARAEEATKRARVERDRLRLTIALAASLLGLILLGGSGWAYLARLKAERRAATERVVTQALDEANLLRGRAKAAAVGDLSKWPDALAAAKQARSLLAAGEPSAALGARVEQLLADLEREQGEAVHRAEEMDSDRRLVERLERIRLARFERGEKWEPKQTDEDYSRGFRDFGIDVDRLAPVEAGHRLRERSNSLDLAFFLDDWVIVRRNALSIEDRVEKDAALWQRLVETARVIDPDPWRSSLRGLVGTTDQDAVKRLAEDEKALAAQPARSLLLLAQLLEAAEDKRRAEKVLKRAWRRRPDDFWICSQLARMSEKDRVRYASIAVALRPRSAQAHVALAEAFLASHAPTPLSNSGGTSCWVGRAEGISLDDSAIRSIISICNVEPDLNNLTVLCYFRDKMPKLEIYNLLPYPLSCATRS